MKNYLLIILVSFVLSGFNAMLVPNPNVWSYIVGMVAGVIMFFIIDNM